MKMTLLDMVQNILSELDGDQVNSIGDTTESLQVAECVRTAYINMLGRYELPEHIQPINLNASDDFTQPTLMTRPKGVTRIEWIRYYDTNPLDSASSQVDQFGSYSHGVNTDLLNNANGFTTTSNTTATIQLGSVQFQVAAGLTIIVGQYCFVIPTAAPNFYLYGIITGYTGTTLSLTVLTVVGSGTYNSWAINQIGPLSLAAPGYKDIEIMPQDTFLSYINSFDLTQSNVGMYTLTIVNPNTNLPSSFTLKFMNDIQPKYCCIISNKYIIFDSYDSTQDSTLQSYKTMAMAWLDPTWQSVDTFIPFLDDQQFPLLLAMAKKRAYYSLKQIDSPVEEREEANQLFAVMKWKSLSDHPSRFQELPAFGRHGNGFYDYRHFR